MSDPLPEGFENGLGEEIQSFLDQTRPQPAPRVIEIPVNFPNSRPRRRDHLLPAYLNDGRLPPDQVKAATKGQRILIALALLFAAAVIGYLYFQ